MTKMSFVAFVIASIAAFGFGYYMQATTKKIIEKGKIKEGRILAIEKAPRKRRGSATPLEDTVYEFEYLVDDKKWVGKYYQKIDETALVDKDSSIGDPIVIKYLPDSPKNFILAAEENKVKDRGKWFMMIGVIVLVFVLFLYLTE